MYGGSACLILASLAFEFTIWGLKHSHPMILFQIDHNWIRVYDKWCWFCGRMLHRVCIVQLEYVCVCMHCGYLPGSLSKYAAAARLQWNYFSKWAECMLQNDFGMSLKKLFADFQQCTFHTQPRSLHPETIASLSAQIQPAYMCFCM